MPTALGLARKLAKGPPLPLPLTKRLAYHGFAPHIEERCDLDRLDQFGDGRAFLDRAAHVERHGRIEAQGEDHHRHDLAILDRKRRLLRCPQEFAKRAARRLILRIVLLHPGPHGQLRPDGLGGRCIALAQAFIRLVAELGLDDLEVRHGIVEAGVTARYADELHRLDHLAELGAGGKCAADVGLAGRVGHEGEGDRSDDLAVAQGQRAAFRVPDDAGKFPPRRLELGVEPGEPVESFDRIGGAAAGLHVHR